LPLRDPDVVGKSRFRAIADPGRRQEEEKRLWGRKEKGAERIARPAPPETPLAYCQYGVTL